MVAERRVDRPRAVTRLRIALALALFAAGSATALYVASSVGLAALATAVERAGPVLVPLALLEIAAWLCETRAAWHVHGGSLRSTLAGASAAYGAAQLAPGGRALGEALRAAHAEVDPRRAASAALALQGSNVALVPLVLALGVAALGAGGRFGALASAAIGWNVLLAAALLGLPRWPRLHGRFGAAAAPPGLLVLARATGWLSIARALQLLQALVLVQALVGAGPRSALGALCLQLLSASAGDAVPGQAGVLEATFAGLGAVITDDPATSVAVALTLRAVRLGLLVLAALLHLLTSGRRSSHQPPRPSQRPPVGVPAPPP